MGKTKGQQYEVGDTVLCYQGLLIYEAKVQNVRKVDSFWQYNVHYKGWSKNWDEWVSSERLLPFTPTNIEKQKENEQSVLATHGKQVATKKTTQISTKRPSGPVPSTSEEKKKKPDLPDDMKTPKKAKGSGDVAGPSSSKGGGKMRPSRSRSNSNASMISYKSTASTKSEDKVALEAKSVTKKGAANSAAKKSGTKKAPAKKKAAAAGAGGKATGASASKSSASKKSSAAGAQGGSKPAAKPILPASTASKMAGLTSVTITALNTKRKPIRPSVIQDKIKFDLPENLIQVLVDDFDYMMRQRKLITLPSRYTVEDLINAYQDFKEHSGTSDLTGTAEVSRGLKDYFNATLGCQLLYKFERIQYADILKEYFSEACNYQMSQIYGPVHLLRLITKLGPILSSSEMEDKCLKALVTHVNDFIEYMSKHSETLFQIEDYGTAPPEYHRRAL